MKPISVDALVADYLNPILKMNTNPYVVLVDADRLAYIAALTVANQGLGAQDLQWCVGVQVHDILTKTTTGVVPDDEFHVVWCMSDTKSFRNKVWPTYKANRIGKWQPSLRRQAKQIMLQDYNAVLVEDLQADDLVGILGFGIPGSLMVSNDKDLLQIPGRHYNPVKNVYCEVTEQEARYNQWMQWLHGDSVDNYPGLRKGFGPAKARKFLEGLDLDDPSKVEERIKDLFSDKVYGTRMQYVSKILHQPVVLETIYSFIEENEMVCQADG